MGKAARLQHAFEIRRRPPPQPRTPPGLRLDRISATPPPNKETGCPQTAPPRARCRHPSERHRTRPDWRQSPRQRPAARRSRGIIQRAAGQMAQHRPVPRHHSGTSSATVMRAAGPTPSSTARRVKPMPSRDQHARRLVRDPGADDLRQRLFRHRIGARHQLIKIEPDFESSPDWRNVSVSPLADALRPGYARPWTTSLTRMRIVTASDRMAMNMRRSCNVFSRACT